jgi:tRNA pseudouridine38-40 synthase
MARNLKITLAYDGTDFHGWQMQPGLQTVQGIFSAAIGRVTGEKVVPQGSGRTDAGVHALAQVASCAIAAPIPPRNLLIALNDTLPAAIRVLNVEEAPPEFHARYSARSKTYRYHILRSAICPPQLARYVYHHPYPLDEAAMAAAAGTVAGEHDFTSFAAVDPEKSGSAAHMARTDFLREGFSGFVGASQEKISNVRRITRSEFAREGEELIYTVEGNGFLHHMVRNLVGTFLLVGKGTLRVEDVKRILERKDRSAAGHTAPPGGLWLVKVDY